MPAFLLDTNHLSAALNRTSTLRERIRRARQSGQRFGTCIPVLSELEVGIQQTANPEANRVSIDARNGKSKQLDRKTIR